MAFGYTVVHVAHLISLALYCRRNVARLLSAIRRHCPLNRRSSRTFFVGQCLSSTQTQESTPRFFSILCMCPHYFLAAFNAVPMNPFCRQTFRFHHVCSAVLSTRLIVSTNLCLLWNSSLPISMSMDFREPPTVAFFPLTYLYVLNLIKHRHSHVK